MSNSFKIKQEGSSLLDNFVGIRNGAVPDRSLGEGQRAGYWDRPGTRAGYWDRPGTESTKPTAQKASMNIGDLRVLMGQQ